MKLKWIKANHWYYGKDREGFFLVEAIEGFKYYRAFQKQNNMWCFVNYLTPEEREFPEFKTLHEAQQYAEDYVVKQVLKDVIALRKMNGDRDEIKVADNQ